MTEAELTTFVQLLAHGKGQATTLADYFDDSMAALAKTSAPFCDNELFSPTDGTADYSYPASAIRILAVIHGDTQLPYATEQDLENYDGTWRATAATEGTPIAWTTLEESARTVRLYPTPDTTAVNGGTFLFAATRTTDLPEFCILPIAFDMLYQEFSYPSDHQDFEFAKLCNELSETLKALIRM